MSLEQIEERWYDGRRITADEWARVWAELHRLRADLEAATAEIAVLREAVQPAFTIGVYNGMAIIDAGQWEGWVRRLSAALATPSLEAERLLVVVEAAKEWVEADRAMRQEWAQNAASREVISLVEGERGKRQAVMDAVAAYRRARGE